jgi:hypothetical protein
MVNANCGGDIDVMIAQLTTVLMVNPSHFSDQCCYPCANFLHHYNPQKYSLVIGSLGTRQADGTIYWEYGSVHLNDSKVVGVDGVVGFIGIISVYHKYSRID